MNYQFIAFPFNFNGVWYSPQVKVTMARRTVKGYMDNIQIKTGKTAQDFWKLPARKVLSSAARLHQGLWPTRNKI
ncbi:MAG: hypothetical protein AUF79_18940 [Crenarchaeota archaeon 13_1_20CM_2_51_8]|nr:MAG: hypothetical protein AUF79_18940 [Crenarchaeota archaeon 13_1_20CM_2_51_8]